ncbi:ATPase [Jannaschia sp. W003]|uniref:ATPase n=1 Tax=Jannaschia sp. W003 TaxID=2867012 RepID=UPI0021A5E37E|nr:ATPase [Jannaschia sp. W003]UWQ20547.1 ATPase [Jannaschia sp. W003]
MLYRTPEDWRRAPRKRVAFFGMSGLGKTHLARILRASGEWFHYSVDYRIGTAHMGEFINDNLKREAMKVPFLRDLLRGDGIWIGANMSFENLSPLSAFLGKPGDPVRGGLAFPEYLRRQDLHVEAERRALLDTPFFVERSADLYGYDHFVCDTGGSICEVVDPDDPADPVLNTLHDSALMVWIRGGEDHVDRLVRRFRADPKPMCYPRAVNEALWAEFSAEHGTDGDPDAFAAFAYERAMRRREPIYGAMAARWGVSVDVNEVSGVRDAADAVEMVARALARRAEG